MVIKHAHAIILVMVILLVHVIAHVMDIAVHAMVHVMDILHAHVIVHVMDILDVRVILHVMDILDVRVILLATWMGNTVVVGVVVMLKMVSLDSGHVFVTGNLISLIAHVISGLVVLVTEAVFLAIVGNQDMV